MTSNIELNRLTARLLENAGDLVVAARLREQMPRFYSHLRRVKKERAVLGRWGHSVNVDELTGTEIVDPRLLLMLGQATDVPMNGPAYHAGVQHTYGYLLSAIKTPFGYKRDRWIQPTIEHGFGLPQSSLQAFPKRGTLLANLTNFLTNITCPDQRPPRIIGANSPITRFDFRQLSGWRITERVGQGSKSRRRTLEIRTDLIPFLHVPKQGSVALLVYSIRENDLPIKLITTFPIGAAALDELLSDKPLGRSVDVRLRFNAHAQGFCGRIIRGSRECRRWNLACSSIGPLPT